MIKNNSKNQENKNERPTTKHHDQHQLEEGNTRKSWWTKRKYRSLVRMHIIILVYLANIYQ